jgi:16S rRNA processing protein RimM
MVESVTGEPGYLVIGTIVGAHGIRGEVKVTPMTDFPERFRPGARVFVGRGPGVRATEIAAARPHKGMWLVKLAAVPDRNAAELLRDQYLLIPEAEAMPLGEHENYVHDLIDLSVVTTEGELLGRITEVIFTPANDVYVVKGDAGELLLPALRSVIMQVDLVARQMTVNLPEGLRD